MNMLYTATATATGDGRNGHATSDDGLLDLDVRVPAAMGGPGGATNPEQLFAAGYAACFHSALKFVAGAEKVDVTGTEVSASVGIGMLDAGGFGLAVELDVARPDARPRRGARARREGAPGLPVLQRHPRQHRGHPPRRLIRGTRPGRWVPGTRRDTGTSGARPSVERRAQHGLEELDAMGASRVRGAGRAQWRRRLGTAVAHREQEPVDRPHVAPAPLRQRGHRVVGGAPHGPLVRLVEHLPGGDVADADPCRRR